MGFLDDLFGVGSKNGINNGRENEPKLKLSLTEKYTANEENKPWQSHEIRDGGKDYQVKGSLTSGSGKYPRQIADELGIQCKGTDSPNPKVVKAAAENLRLMPTGSKHTELFTKNNGGSGLRNFSTPRYSDKQESQLKAEIERKSILVDSEKGLYKYNEIPFRVDNGKEK